MISQEAIGRCHFNGLNAFRSARRSSSVRVVDAVTLLDRLWAEGAGVDDRQAIATARESGGDTADQLALWNDWITTEDGHTTGTHEELAARLAVDPACRLLIVAIELRAAVTRRDLESIDQALETIDQLLGVTPRDERGTTAHAAADLALAETALFGKDLPAARRCLDGVAAGGPPAIRITALMRMATLSLANVEVRNAQKRARQALTLARSTKRTGQANQAQLLLGLISAMNDEPAAMRGALEPLVAAEPNNSVTRFLLAGLEGNERALEILAEGLTTAARQGDALGYALCGLVGSRRYVALGRRGDALLTMSMVRMQLKQVDLLSILEAELQQWKQQWGDEAFEKAEREAMALLRRDTVQS
jgi:hypothetical protein